MLSPASLAQIDQEVAKYPSNQRQSAVMSALRIAQVEKGWLAIETMDFIADYLGMPAIAVYEVATFYNMYNTVPTGKYKVTLCTNISCMLMGAPEMAEHLKQRLGCEFGETTADGKFTLKEGECMGACGDAPLCLINNHRMESFLTAEKIDTILEELK
ncbi:MAG TPA: NADH-quinone oxidoreductase subunit NuoE [Burkholderiales bacterium]|nr:NADH-quinone oxidoreductase subunit NuoE [Burkholderiales bacterium]